MKRKLPYITAIVGLIVYIVLMQTCNSGEKPTEKTENFHKETTKTITDTVIIVGEKLNVPIYKIKWLIKNTTDTLFLEPQNVSNKLDTFLASIKDSLLEANITVYAKERPFIDFSYELRNFETTITKNIKDSTYKEIKIRKGYMSFGATILGSKTNFGFAPIMQYNRKSGMTYSGGYDIINRNLHVGFTKKISFRRKN